MMIFVKPVLEKLMNGVHTTCCKVYSVMFCSVHNVVHNLCVLLDCQQTEATIVNSFCITASEHCCSPVAGHFDM